MPVQHIEGSDVPHVDAGEYVAVIGDIDNTVTRFGAGYKVTHQLITEDGFKVSQIFSTATTPGSKLGQMLKMMTGRGLPPRAADKRRYLACQVAPAPGLPARSRRPT